MKLQEALSILKSQERWANTFVMRETAKMAVQALEKQIPRKPKNIGGELFCPICDRHFGHNWAYSHESDLYCRDCGQAIDWSEDDE